MTENDEPRPPRALPERERDAPRAPRPGGERAPAHYIDDRWTKLFVAGVIIIFALVFANAIFLGRGGLLTATPTPTPVPIVTPSPGATP